MKFCRFSFIKETTPYDRIGEVALHLVMFVGYRAAITFVNKMMFSHVEQRLTLNSFEVVILVSLLYFLCYHKLVNKDLYILLAICCFELSHMN